MKIPTSFIEQNFSPADFLENCREAFLGYGQGSFTMAPREEYVDEAGRFTLKMPAQIPGYTGYKFIEELPAIEGGKLGQRTAIIKLKPDNTNEVEMDAEFITNMRTGAAGVLGMSLLAPGSKHIAILGTGKISTALAWCAVEMGVETIAVFSRKPENRAKFKEELSGLKVKIILHDSIPSCVSKVESILTAVPTAEPILFFKDLPSRVYISVMGGDSRTTQLDQEVMTRAWIVPDNEAQCQKSGEFKIAQQRGYYEDIHLARVDGRVANIGDVVSNRLTSDRDVAVGYFTGLAVQDINVARMVYEKFMNIGRVVK